MAEVCCSQCNTHLGWQTYCGPTGGFYCDECHEKDLEEENARGIEDTGFDGNLGASGR